MLTDAHLHLVDLERLDPGFPERIPAPGWTACASSHDRAEWERSEALRAALPPTLASFGIHPQNAVLDNAGFLSELAAAGRIDCVGEAGFDFFGDEPDRNRDPENLRRQRACFEFQADLAAARGLPLLVHMRKATDVMMGYCPRLRRLPSVIFHCWPGRAGEGFEFLRKGVNAFFSFGTPLLREGPRATESCALLPAERILSETDAPWQPPHGSEFTAMGDIDRITSHIARLRGLDTEGTGRLLRDNFLRAFMRGAKTAE